jgi:acyl carrier protein
MKIYSREEALRKIEVIFQEQFLDIGLKISESSSPETVEDWDSMGHISIVTAVENGFSISFSIEEIGEVGSVSDLLNILVRHQVISN